MNLIENLEKQYKQFLLWGTVLCYIIWTLIQIYYLTKYNSLQFFSITQSITDWLYFFMYFIVYILIPCVLIPMLVWKYNEWVNKFEWRFIVFIFITLVFYIFLMTISFVNYWDLLLSWWFFSWKTLLLIIMPIWLLTFSFYLYGYILFDNTKLLISTKNRYKKILYNFIYKVFSLVIFFSLFILPFWVSFEFSAVNLLVNLPLFIILVFYYVSVAISILNRKNHDKLYLFNDTWFFRKLQWPFWWFMTFLLLYMFFSPILYIYRFGIFSIQQYTNYWFAYTENGREYTVLYKNDKYIITLDQDNHEKNIVLPIEKVIFFKTNQNSSDDTIDNFISNIKKTYNEIPLFIKDIKSIFINYYFFIKTIF